MLSDSVKRILTHTEYSYIQHETNYQNDKKRDAILKNKILYITKKDTQQKTHQIFYILEIFRNC